MCLVLLKLLWALFQDILIMGFAVQISWRISPVHHLFEHTYNLCGMLQRKKKLQHRKTTRTHFPLRSTDGHAALEASDGSNDAGYTEVVETVSVQPDIILVM